MSVKSEIEDIELLRDEYSSKSGMPKVKDLEECEILDWSIKDLQSKTNEELYDALFILAQLSLNVQRMINYKMVRVHWAENTMMKVLGREAGKYNFFSYQEKTNAVIANDDYAGRVHDLKTKSQTIVDSLSYIPSKIDYINKQLDTILRSRRENSYAARSSS